MNSEHQHSINTEACLALKPEIAVGALTALAQNPGLFTRQMQEKLANWAPRLDQYLQLRVDQIDLDYRQDFLAGSALAAKIVQSHGLMPRTSDKALAASYELSARNTGSTSFQALENRYPQLYLQIDRLAGRLEESSRVAFQEGFTAVFDPIEKTLVGEEMDYRYGTEKLDRSQPAAESPEVGTRRLAESENDFTLKIDDEYIGLRGLGKYQYSHFMSCNLNFLSKCDPELKRYIDREAEEYMSDQELQVAFLLGAAAAVDLVTEGAGERPAASRETVKTVETIWERQYAGSLTRYCADLCARYPQLEELILKPASEAFSSVREGHAFIEGFTQLFAAIEQQVLAEEFEQLY